jgi:hypothetical protein
MDMFSESYYQRDIDVKMFRLEMKLAELYDNGCYA